MDESFAELAGLLQFRDKEEERVKRAEARKKGTLSEDDKEMDAWDKEMKVRFRSCVFDCGRCLFNLGREGGEGGDCPRTAMQVRFCHIRPGPAFFGWEPKTEHCLFRSDLWQLITELSVAIDADLWCLSAIGWWLGATTTSFGLKMSSSWFENVTGKQATKRDSANTLAGGGFTKLGLRQGASSSSIETANRARTMPTSFCAMGAGWIRLRLTPFEERASISTRGGSSFVEEAPILCLVDTRCSSGPVKAQSA